MKKNIGFLLLFVCATILLIKMANSGPEVQDEAYHNFADGRTIFLIPNFWNVFSNLPFLFVGLLGILHYRKYQSSNFLYYLFFFGILMVSFGSGYYHLNPNNETLVWDRLPMTIGFMSLFLIVIREFISIKATRILSIPLLLSGIVSIIVWRFSNTEDLRMYLLVQFYPILAIPIILIFFKSMYSKVRGYWVLLLAYIIAKVFERLDGETYELLKIISGHSIKHLMAAAGIYVLLISYQRRTITKPEIETQLT